MPSSKKTTRTVSTWMYWKTLISGQLPSSRSTPLSRFGITTVNWMWLLRLPLPSPPSVQTKSTVLQLAHVHPVMGVRLASLESSRTLRATWMASLQRLSRATVSRCSTNCMKPTWPLKRELRLKDPSLPLCETDRVECNGQVCTNNQSKSFHVQFLQFVRDIWPSVQSDLSSLIRPSKLLRMCCDNWLIKISMAAKTFTHCTHSQQSHNHSLYQSLTLHSV